MIALVGLPKTLEGYGSTLAEKIIRIPITQSWLINKPVFFVAMMMKAAFDVWFWRTDL